MLCTICNKPLSGKATQYCSDECRKVRARQIYKDSGVYCPTGLDNGTAGAVSELRAAADLLSRGYEVFRALSPTCSCDLIAFKNSRIIRVEVRTGHYHLGDSGKPLFGETKQKHRADILALVCPGAIFYYPELTLP